MESSSIRGVALFLVLTTISCGGTVEKESSGGSGSGATGTGAASGTGAGTTGGAGATGGESVGGAGANGSEGGSGGTGSADVTYAVAAWPGGLDHLIIMRADESAGTCIRMFVDAPMDASFAVITPEPWGLSGIAAFEGTAGCLDSSQQPSGETVNAISASGTISWDLQPGNDYPCELSLDVSASFSQPPPWLASGVVMNAVDVPVDGGCF